ncbi:helix-turn-helix domain-containing protein [Lonepinella sp. BR2882]|uniref:helix-turn-helix domain-containing protein n=1 Tax=Lonepinella sp. BR2882 TaxID=3095283 RepID=UPI003F6DB3FA
MSKESKSAIIFPNYQQSLNQLGENIKLAIKRRRYTQTLIAERTGLSRLTVRKITQGDPSVSIGHYTMVLGILNLVEDWKLVAKDDELGKKLQDIALLKGAK